MFTKSPVQFEAAGSPDCRDGRKLWSRPRAPFRNVQGLDRDSTELVEVGAASPPQVRVLAHIPSGGRWFRRAPRAGRTVRESFESGRGSTPERHDPIHAGGTGNRTTGMWRRPSRRAQTPPSLHKNDRFDEG